MTGQDVSGFLAGCAVLAVVYFAGGAHGLLMAWTHQARMQGWADKVHRVWMRSVEGERRLAEIAEARRSARSEGAGIRPAESEGHLVRGVE